VQGIRGIEGNGRRGPLRARPERLARGSHLVDREVVQELGDAVVKALLKLEPRPRHTIGESFGARVHQHAFHLLKSKEH